MYVLRTVNVCCTFCCVVQYLTNRSIWKMFVQYDRSLGTSPQNQGKLTTRNAKSSYSEDDIIKMLGFLVDNIFVVFSSEKSSSLLMGTNCAPLLADIFLYSLEADFIVFALNGKETFSISVQPHLQVHRWWIVHKQPRIRKLSEPGVSCWTWNQRHHREHNFCFLSRFTNFPFSLLSTGKKHSASRFNLTYRYIDDELSINNLEFENYLSQAYPAELEIKDTTESTTSASYLDLQTFRSWVATSHLRPPMAFLSHNSSDTPGLAPLMNVLFWGRCDFPISFSGRDMSRNVWNRL